MQISSKKQGKQTSGGNLADPLRALPSVGKLLEVKAFCRLAREWGGALVLDLLREELERLREEFRAKRLTVVELRRSASAASLARRVEAGATKLTAPSPRVVINATGVIVHTNLGRSILSEGGARRVAQAATGYMDLEYDLATGNRGSRLSHLEPLISRLFPGHGFLVVNNNASAIMLALRALAEGKEVVVSRGELVEIGGSFRVPEILAASGARLREVGTTNRTRLGNYEKALSDRTGVLLKVHTSNFKIVGFTEEATVGKLASLARRVSVPLVVDWGSGDLVDLGPLDIHDEIPVVKILEQGADLVTFSGDKLLGGPQAGFVVGRRELVARLRKDPLARVCRVDRLLVGAIHETLSAYVRGKAFEEIPTLKMLALSSKEIGERATRVRREVARATGSGSRLALAAGVSRTGGGSSPMGQRPTKLLAIGGGSGGDAGSLERSLRLGDPPVLGRMHEGKLLLDLRTVLPSQDAILVKRLARAILEEERGTRSKKTKKKRTKKK